MLSCMHNLMNEQEQTMEQRVMVLVAETLHQKVEDITLATRIEDLAEDSIALFGLITAFEKEFNLEANYEDLLEIETVGDIIRYFEKEGVSAS